MCASAPRQECSSSENAETLAPELGYHVIQPLLFGVMALTTLRMKYLWTPYMCVLASVGLCYTPAWRGLLRRCGVHSDTIVSLTAMCGVHSDTIVSLTAMCG